VTEEPDPWASAPLLDLVTVSEAPELSSELAARLPLPSSPRAVSVTDLLSVRRAYWRKVRGPAPVAVDRELKLEEGKRWHRRLGDALAAEGSLEVRIRRGGLTARIDVLTDVPVEVKTGTVASGAASLEEWPDHVEQLAAYCALAENPVGRLVHLRSREAGPPDVAVREFRFRDVDAWRTTLEQRRDSLRRAIDARDPASLGRCRWFAKGCEYRASAICPCTGEEPLDPGTELVESRLDRADIAERWRGLLDRQPAEPEEGPAHFRDLLYPRRSYYDRTAQRPPLGHAPRPTSAPLDAFERTHAALESGGVGSVHRLCGRPGAPSEEILAWRGDPCLVRTSRVHGHRSPEEIRTRTPQYLLDLGLRCGLTGRSSATLVLGYEPGGPPGAEVQVFRLEVAGGAAAFASAWEARRRAVERAVEARTPERLPPCPAWMARDCAYREVCGCGAEGARSHR
jgi:hypothetical protein